MKRTRVERPRVLISKSQSALFKNSLDIEFTFSGTTLDYLPANIKYLVVQLTKPFNVLEIQLIVSTISSSRSLTFTRDAHKKLSKIRVLYWSLSKELAEDIIEGKYLLVRITNELYKLNKL